MKNFSKVTVILRGYSYEQTKTVMEALVQSSIRAVEITLNTEGALETIEKISKEYGDRVSIGAGTVKNIDDARNAIKAGAKFILTPIVVSKDVIDECKRYNVKSVIGAMSPTEVWWCYENGADIVKIFPARACGSNYIKDIKAPLGNIKVMAVGGVSVQNAKEFLQNGADYLGIGSSLFNKEDVDSKNIEALVNTLKELEKEIQ
ncbi:2-dehydro-3-deoxy-6-phosphogalactonate aldolase [bioreactor metagenome]|jgi:2-dehydro-3-deoxyphosphogluconate aldolase / (4S)-4-hydroxy-2-oxoglutarate aldolase|uniref:2-dehydro-3-deoxy-6-phosphogalactonate aldolase n=1 Tax=bioreactor metagenome TaxID=1076179 RepID=A0A644XIS5_9ZZZZ